MKTEYYIEFVIRDGQDSYTMQSRWFKTKREALKWLKNSFDFIRTSDMRIFLMSGTFDDLGDLDGDIEEEKELEWTEVLLNVN